jgi:hypothetical protein
MTTRIILLTGVAVFLSGCLSMDTKCCDLIASYPISPSLYVEKYRTFCAGVFGDLTECYLTDSVSFRQQIGTYDEHESFRVKLDGDKIETYNFQSDLIPDTAEKKTFTKAALWQNHHTDSNCLTTIPIFGKNTIKCDTDFFPAWSYKTEDGYYIAHVQYKCGNDYSNAAFFTDSLHFSVFIGVYVPGSLLNNYSAKLNSDNNFDFYNVEEKRKIDTVRADTYLLPDLKKGKLVKVCK